MPRIFAALLALAGAIPGTLWVIWQEMIIRSYGVPLPDSVKEWGLTKDIRNLEKIRVLHAEVIPLPAPMFLRRIINRLGFPATNVGGLALRYGIYLEKRANLESAILRHELIHTRQYQEAGSAFHFILKYLYQCLTEGYYDCTMEREARELSKSSDGV